MKTQQKLWAVHSDGAGCGGGAEGEEREVWWRKQIKRNRARTTPEEGNYWHLDNHRSLVPNTFYSKKTSWPGLYGTWTVGISLLASDIRHPCVRSCSSTTGSCPKTGCHCSSVSPQRVAGDTSAVTTHPSLRHISILPKPNPRTESRAINKIKTVDRISWRGLLSLLALAFSILSLGLRLKSRGKWGKCPQCLNALLTHTGWGPHCKHVWPSEKSRFFSMAVYILLKAFVNKHKKMSKHLTLPFGPAAENT